LEKIEKLKRVNVRNELGDQTFIDNLFSHNIALDDGGGVNSDTDSGKILFANNVLSDNVAQRDGGGVDLDEDDDVVGGQIVVTNNTLFNNVAGKQGGGLLMDVTMSGLGNIYNNIIYGNVAGVNGNDISIDDDNGGGGGGMSGARINLFNNDFDSTPITGFFLFCRDDPTSDCTPNLIDGGNINEDPLFVDENKDTRDLHLTENSPCIDTGDPNAPDMPDKDFDGEPRPAEPGTNPDMGAFEFQPVPPPPPPPVPPLDIFGGCSCGFGTPPPGMTWWLLWTTLTVFGVAGFRLRKRE